MKPSVMVSIASRGFFFEGGGGETVSPSLPEFEFKVFSSRPVCLSTRLESIYITIIIVDEIFAFHLALVQLGKA